ncbi:hypothetical protein [Gemmobacter caeruleus]|uniref:hypothetical protein n=1 Tax=Gemmobacter caeruleus TaxID=2595004 RepID=UPI0011ECB402|nr:hypothetical protein [Gemmobacter caeruleus]
MLRFLLPLCLVAAPAFAQSFTTAAEVKPILQATRANWIAVREYDGKDLVYFTHLESWRCGLDRVVFAINGGALSDWPLPPCAEGTAQPNAIPADHLPFIEQPLGQVQRVDVMVVYDDGSADSASFDRAAVLMP